MEEILCALQISRPHFRICNQMFGCMMGGKGGGVIKQCYRPYFRLRERSHKQSCFNTQCHWKNWVAMIVNMFPWTNAYIMLKNPGVDADQWCSPALDTQSAIWVSIRNGTRIGLPSNWRETRVSYTNFQLAVKWGWYKKKLELGIADWIKMILKVSLVLLFVTLLVAHTIPSQTFSREDRDFRPLQVHLQHFLG